ncbi:MAG: helicase-related protein [Chloroflexia bacterium]
MLLRPLGGTDEDACGIYLPLEPDVESASFALPDPLMAGDSTAALLLRDATRLNFRAGAGPFRSLGRIAVEPRAYQLVPLLMALRLSPVRILIADDVGIGKTVEAALIARELLDRGDIRRVAVLCPPHLCDQWQAELASKFHLDAEVVRPGTVARLERGLTVSESLFDRYPVLVVSIDYIKSDRRRADFVRACPEFVIVDEAHICAAATSAGGGRGGQQQRHRLVADLAADPNRHLVLTTATPHSGIEVAFRSLLSLLHPDFGALPDDLTQAQDQALRQRLAAHFVQRRRGDILTYVDERTTFPERVTAETTYDLGPAYRAFFDKVHAYATELVQSAQNLSHYQQRICWWAALALLRCVTSSPAAAAATLTTRATGLAATAESAPLDIGALDTLGERAVLDLDTADAADGDDVVPGADTLEGEEPNSRERRRLRDLAREAVTLAGAGDRKLIGAQALLQGLLDDGFQPIVYCRYIATAEYLAEELRKRLKGVEVVAVTGRLPAEDRAERVAALLEHERRVLVATDCLSEGINLQEGFDAVLHYDLSWNPTRHEQREGRVDRYGQSSPQVRTILYYGADNRVDGAIMRVLLRKAETIRKSLGVSVPVPTDTNKVLEAVFEALLPGRRPTRAACPIRHRRAAVAAARRSRMGACRRSRASVPHDLRAGDHQG